MSEITKPRGLSVECYYCKKSLPAERHTSYNYHESCDSVYHYPYSELKGIEWNYLGGQYACKNCLDKKEEIILNDLLKSHTNHLDRMPNAREFVKKNYDAEIDKFDKTEQRLKLIIEELSKHTQVNLNISEEVQGLISDGYRWKDELKQLFTSPNRSMDSSNL